MDGVSANQDDLAAFVDGGRAFADSLEVIRGDVSSLRSQVLAEVGHAAAPPSSAAVLRELLDRAAETNNFVASVHETLTAPVSPAGFGLSTLSSIEEFGATGPFGVTGRFSPVVGLDDAVGFVGDQAADLGGWLFDTAGSAAEFSADVGEFVGEQVADAGRRTLDGALTVGGYAVDGAQAIGDPIDDAIVNAAPVAAAVPEFIGLTHLGPLYGPTTEQFNRHVTPLVVRGVWSELDRWLPDRDTTGDPGGAFTSRPTGDRLVNNATDPTRDTDAIGRQATISALHDTADPTSVHDDEFELIRHDNNTYTVVLAGVVDLTNPSAGLDDSHFSARDTDAVAARSAASAGIEDNAYAVMVARSLAHNGVPPGADLLIVGHSQGADTALDLAADPTFNGGVYNVSHVVAAGYHSEPQLDSVQPNTEVLLLQNNKDLVVLAENFGHLSDDPFEDFTPAPAGTIIREFDGGWQGFGHHQNNYTSYLQAEEADPQVETFFTSIAQAGFGDAGEARAIDISLQ